MRDCAHKLLNFLRKHRLVNKQDFDNVFSQAKKVSQGCLLALYVPNQYTYARLGVVLSKHRLKLAVRRNQLRRIIRESFRHQTALPNLDIIIMLKSGSLPKDKKDLRDNIDKLWHILIKSYRPA